MKAPSASGKYGIMAEINMIPFIDVSLVLLIIFMVMTPFLVKSQIRVNLPPAGKVDQGAPEKEALRVQVDSHGTIAIDGQVVKPDEIVPTLRRLMRDPKTQPLFIEADKDVSFEHVVMVLDAGRQIGAARLGVGVKHDTSRKSGK